MFVVHFELCNLNAIIIWFKGKKNSKYSQTVVSLYYKIASGSYFKTVL